MNTVRTASLVFLAATSIATLGAAQSGADTARPGYSFLRQNEDWSLVGDALDSDPFDALKRVPLSKSGSTWASFGASLRLRVEDWTGFNFGSAPPGFTTRDTYLLTLFRAHADVHVGERLRFFGELKSALSTDRTLPGGVRPVDYDSLALQQLFADIDIPLDDSADLVVRPGRQMIALGAQRLISPLPWANVLRTWDGLTAAFSAGRWNLTGLGTAFVPVDKTGFNETDWNRTLFGLYATRRHEQGPGGLDLYVLANGFENATYNGTSGDEQRQTLGARFHGPFAGSADYDVEVDYQFGSVGSGSVSAWSFASQVGYRPARSLRLFAGLDWASGDDEAGGDVGTFNQLYPLGHAYLGIVDVLGRQNVVDTSAGTTWNVAQDVALTLAGHSFWVDKTSDAIYGVGGQVVRPAGSYQSSSIGQEIDLVARWKTSRHLTTEVGYGHFFAGSAIEESGSSEDIDFFYVQAAFRF